MCSSAYDVSVILTKARRAGKLRDSYGMTVHGEIPEGASPRKLTVRPWKASDFPALQSLFWDGNGQNVSKLNPTLKGAYMNINMEL